ncbi:hypothetical protein TARUN_2950 [Trichoderma arundinaceum]|uniref:MACPF domain-containing protein n=1 Tax=Trichoderma arundinaceum TaxID=490622 RepID=A0A395NTB5_TRIAR|nr:hypothetical protein TARUN_2950 [Trichoderma arundinaceum]
MASDDVPVFNDVQLLGQSIVLLPNGADAFALDAVNGPKSRIVILAKEYKSTEFPGGKAYSIPENTELFSGARTTVTNTLRVETGSELASDFDTQNSLSASYAGISASASAQYSYHSSLISSNWYAIVSVDHKSFLLSLQTDLYDNINPKLIAAAQALPPWSINTEVYATYMDFFNRWGTHVMLACTFGARYQLRVESDSSSKETRESFHTHVSAEYSGVASIKGDSSVKNTENYKSYLKTRSSQALVYGGADGPGVILSHAPDYDSEKYDKAFEDWANSLNDALATNLVNVRVDSIGKVLQGSPHPDHQEVSEKLVSAMDYISKIRVLQGTIECTASGLVTNPHYECLVDGDPGLELKYLKALSGSIRGRQLSPNQIGIDLDNTSSLEVRAGSNGKVQVMVTTPPQPSNVHFKKPGDPGHWGVILDLTPYGPIVKSSAKDSQAERVINVDGSLCETGKYGE